MKKNLILYIIIVILLCLCTGMGVYIFMSKSNTVDNNKDSNTKSVETKISANEAEIMKSISLNIFDASKTNLKVSDIDDVTILYVISTLQDKNITDINKDEFNNIYHEYFNTTEDLTFVGIPCGMDHGSTDMNNMLIFDSNSGKYIYNEKHPGHGGTAKNDVITKLNNISMERSDDNYKLVMSAFYADGQCMGDVCGPGLTSSSIYLKYNDALNKTNSLFDAVKNNYCSVSFTDGDLLFYTCDYDKVYNDIKDKVQTITFNFIKRDNKLLFDNYSLN